MPTTSPRLRADAAANRTKILDAAREVFAAEGLGVPMSEIASRAGLGVATLYRRFPTKEDLVAEAFSEQVTQCAGLLDAALADPDPWHAFCKLIAQVCAMQVRDRGFSGAFVTVFPARRGSAHYGSGPSGGSPNWWTAHRQQAHCAPTSTPPT